jgi:uncharacterized protein YgiM (DUF1202 family)
MKRIGLLGLVILLMATMLPLTTAAATQYGTVTGGWLRLRSGPSYDSSIINSYYTGSVVEILSTSGSWYYVKTADSNTGYMLSSYVTLGGSSTGTTAYVTSSNGLGVRMRTGPSTGYRVIAVYDVGTQVTVLATGVIWSRIQVGTTVGYMMSEFLTTSPGPTPTTSPSSDMATVRSDNGYGVRLRSGAGTGYSILGIYSVGTRVSVITRGTTWDYIQVGSRLGYMMNEFLTYDHSTVPVATAITLTAPSTTGMQNEVIALTPSVTGTNLSSPAYTLAITGNASMAELSGNNLHILSTATVGQVIQVTATSVDNNGSGVKITATCSITVTVAQPRVTAFSFDDTTATVSIVSGDVQRRIGYSISGYNLTSPYFTLAVSSEAGSNVTTAIDTASEEIVLNISSAIADGTVFTVTGTTVANDSGGNPKTATITVTITDDTLTLTSIVITPDDSTLRYDETTNINARLYYSDGSSTSATYSTDYTLSVTTGSTYASLGGKLLVPNAATLIGVANQTIVVTGTAVANTSLTDTCDVLLYGRNVPGAPTLTGTTAAHNSVTLTWTAPTNDGGDSITGYKAYYSLTSGGTKNLLSSSISASSTSYTATGLIDGTQYYFYVLATNAQGDGAYSNALAATPNPTQPSAPQSLAVSSRGNGFVTLTWSAPSNTGGSGVLIDHYMVYLDGGSGVSVSAATYSWTGLTNGVSHEFTVIAVNSATAGLPSSITSNAVGTPGAPTIGTNVAGYQQIAITWAPSTTTGGNAIQSYKVYIKVATDDDSTATEVTGITDTTYTFTQHASADLTNQEYEMWVISYNGYSYSAASTHVTSTPYEAPSAPTLTAVANSPANGSASLSWTAPTDNGGQALTYYKIVYTPTGGSPNSPIIVSAATLAQVISGLSTASYNFTISATNDGTHYGTTDTESSVSITAAP